VLAYALARFSRSSSFARIARILHAISVSSIRSPIKSDSGTSRLSRTIHRSFRLPSESMPLASVQLHSSCSFRTPCKAHRAIRAFWLPRRDVFLLLAFSFPSSFVKRLVCPGEPVRALLSSTLRRPSRPTRSRSPFVHSRGKEAPRLGLFSFAAERHRSIFRLVSVVPFMQAFGKLHVRNCTKRAFLFRRVVPLA